MLHHDLRPLPLTEGSATTSAISVGYCSIGWPRLPRMRSVWPSHS